jgi:sulfofructose kinase
MSDATYDVLGLGAVAVDDLLYVDEFPMPDGKTPVQARERAGGGLAGTALVAAARLGTRAAYCGVLDGDELSRFTIEALEREGVDCSRVRRQPGARPYHSIIIVVRGTGQRCILFSGAGAQAPGEADLPESLIAASRVLLVDYTVPEAAIRAAGLARRHGRPVVGDVEAIDFPEREAFLASVDHLILGQAVAAELTGEREPAASAQRLARHGVVVVTAGAEGCWWALPGQPPQHVPALRVAAVDTTGCGDAFHGAYAACLAWGGAPPEAVRVATVTAGLKATRPGGRAGLPDRAAVEKALAELDKG